MTRQKVLTIPTMPTILKILTPLIILTAVCLPGCSDYHQPNHSRYDNDYSSNNNSDNDNSSDAKNTSSSKSARLKVGSKLIPQAHSPIPDLPIPIGFKMVESISRNYESAGARFIDHTYEGRADKFDVSRFCRVHMPENGWTIRGSQMVRGVFLMRFEKESEYCEVRIGGDKSFTGQRSTLSYNVQTLGRGEMPIYKEELQRIREELKRINREKKN